MFRLIEISINTLRNNHISAKSVHIQRATLLMDVGYGLFLNLCLVFSKFISYKINSLNNFEATKNKKNKCKYDPSRTVHY